MDPGIAIPILPARDLHETRVRRAPRRHDRGHASVTFLPWPLRAVRRTVRRALLAGAALSLAGCSDLTGGDCIAIGAFAVTVTVLDAQTGQPPASATLVVTDGAFREVGTVLPTAGRLTLVAAAEREGTYAVTVSAPGYRDWTQTGVSVRRGGRCDALRPAQLTARLARAGAS